MDDKKSITVEVMTEEIESALLKDYPQLPVARQNEGEITVMCRHVLTNCITTIQTSNRYRLILIDILTPSMPEASYCVQKSARTFFHFKKCTADLEFL